MNLLFVSDVSIHAVIGGAERVLHEQATRLAARGHRVHILTRRLADHRSNCETIRQVLEWRYSVIQHNASSFLASTLRNGRVLFESLHRTNNFDCINFHQPFSALAVLRSPSSTAIPKIYTCHSLAFEEYASRNPKPRPLLKKLLHTLHIESRKRIEKKVLRGSDGIIVLSRYTRDKLSSIYEISADRVHIVPGGIDLGRFHPAADKRAVRKQLGLPLDAPLLFTVRNLVPRMGIENLISAMRDVVRAVPDVRLIIGGAGPLRSDLTALSRGLNLESAIQFTGFIPEEALLRYYQAADLFVLPTAELEGFGLVTLEALASGTPVLGTPVGGTQEILGGLDSGFLFRDASPEAISQSIIETCRRYQNRPDQLERDSRRCRDFAEKNYSWDANVDATEHLFEQIIGAGQRPWSGAVAVN